MKWQIPVLSCLLTLNLGGMVLAQQSQSPPSAPPAKTPAKQNAPAQSAPKSDSGPAQDDQQQPTLDPDTLLQVAVQQAGGDSAALVRNLEDYLVRFPDSPRRVAIYRALMQTEMQLHNQKSALDYAEKAIAIEPDDGQTMYVAVTVLEKMPDDASQAHAIDYDTRLIEQIAKANPESRPQQMTLDDWQTGRNKFMKDLYVSRGRLERHLHKNDEATKDLNTAFRLLPSSEAALTLGEIAEEAKQTDEAVRQYALAFILSGQERNDPANQNSLRLRMGNLWRFTHNSNAGLGDILLAAFDKSTEMAKQMSMVNQPGTVAYNKGITDPLQFSLRQVDGKGAVKLADIRGKVVILNFWTTWCAYCRTMESMLGDVEAKFAGRDDVLSLAVNADEDGALVAPFLQDQKVGGTLVFADGLEQALHIESIPTVIVLDRTGKIVYRTQGYAPQGFVDAISAAITKASAAPAH